MTDEINTVGMEASKVAKEEDKGISKRIRIISNFLFVFAGEALTMLFVIFDVPYVIGYKVYEDNY